MRLHAKLALLLASHLHQVTEQRPTTNPHGAHTFAAVLFAWR